MSRKRLGTGGKNSSGGTVAGEVQIIGAHPDFVALLEYARECADTDLPILILGETGTGKSFLARAIHHWSGRSSGPYVAVNCGALTESLAASEFFGHEPGAFTGATTRKEGLVKRADRGTLFLDDVGTLHPNVQPTLLEVTDTNSYKPVGSDYPVYVDVRFISATVSDLWLPGACGFRSDLLQRLGAVTLRLPPLRERRSDIPLLAQHFLDVARHNHKTTWREISSDCLETILAYNWPGNIRELSNTVKLACAQGKGEVLEIRNVGASSANSSERPFRTLQRERRLHDEREYYDNMLKQCSGDIQRTARRAGVSNRTVYRKAKEHAIDLDAYRKVQER
jgi:DNA-binding NtrC family response regulator